MVRHLRPPPAQERNGRTPRTNTTPPHHYQLRRPPQNAPRTGELKNTPRPPPGSDLPLCTARTEPPPPRGQHSECRDPTSALSARKALTRPGPNRPGPARPEDGAASEPRGGGAALRERAPPDGERGAAQDGGTDAGEPGAAVHFEGPRKPGTDPQPARQGAQGQGLRLQREEGHVPIQPRPPVQRPETAAALPAGSGRDRFSAGPTDSILYLFGAKPTIWVYSFKCSGENYTGDDVSFEQQGG